MSVSGFGVIALGGGVKALTPETAFAVVGRVVVTLSPAILMAERQGPATTVCGLLLMGMLR